MTEINEIVLEEIKGQKNDAIFAREFSRELFFFNRFPLTGLYHVEL
jgi:hypothetical protein